MGFYTKLQPVLAVILTVFKRRTIYLIARFTISNACIPNHSDAMLCKLQQILQSYFVGEGYGLIHHVISVVINRPK